MSGNLERTYLMIKPDGVQRGLVGEIIKRFEQKGFKLVALKFVQVCVGNTLIGVLGNVFLCKLIIFFYVSVNVTSLLRRCCRNTMLICLVALSLLAW